MEKTSKLRQPESLGLEMGSSVVFLYSLGAYFQIPLCASELHLPPYKIASIGIRTTGIDPVSTGDKVSGHFEPFIYIDLVATILRYEHSSRCRTSDNRCCREHKPREPERAGQLEPRPHSPDPLHPKSSKRKARLSKAATAVNPRKIAVAAATPEPETESGQSVSSNQSTTSNEAQALSHQSKLTRGSTAPSPSQGHHQMPPRSPLSRHVETPKPDDADNNNSGSNEDNAASQHPSRCTLSRKQYGEMVETQEVEALCPRLGMTRKDVWRLCKQFNDEDTENTYAVDV